MTVLENKRKSILLTIDVEKIITDINIESHGHYKKKDLELSTARVMKYFVRKFDIPIKEGVEYKIYKRHYYFIKQLIIEGTGNFLKSLLVKGKQKLISDYDFEALYNKSVKLRNNLRNAVDNIKSVEERNTLYEFIEALIDDITRPHLSRERMTEELKLKHYTRSTIIVNHNKIIRLIENRYNGDKTTFGNNAIEDKRYIHYNIQEYTFIKCLIIQMMDEQSYLYKSYKSEVDKKINNELGNLELSEKFYNEMLPSIKYAYSSEYQVMLNEMLLWLSRLHYEKIINGLQKTIDSAISKIFDGSNSSDINNNLNSFNKYIENFKL